MLLGSWLSSVSSPEKRNRIFKQPIIPLHAASLIFIVKYREMMAFTLPLDGWITLLLEKK